MTISTAVERRQGRRRSSLAIITLYILGSVHSPAVAADPMMPSAYLKENHLARSVSNKPFKKTHAERMEYRARRWKEFHSGTYSGVPPANYGGQHPFELMAAKRARKEQTGAKSDTVGTTRQLRSRELLLGGTYSDKWHDKNWDPDANPDDWHPTGPDADNRHNFKNFKPIRIGVNVDNLPSDNASSDKNRFVENEVMRAATQFWTKALNVYPAKSISVDSEFCEDLPPLADNVGIDDTDLMLYVYAEKFCGGGQMAAAAACTWDKFNRPVAGIVRFCYDSLNLQSDGTADEMTAVTVIETAIHEVGHVLGLKSDEMAFYYNHETGQLRNDNLEITQSFECLDGSKKDVYAPTEETLQKGQTASGIQYFEVITPTVRQIARNHFNCPTMKGIRLENQPTNSDCFGSHFEERMLWNGLMTALAETAHVRQHLTAFTLGLLEDTGWYKPNYSLSENVAFGLGAGCDFVEKDCIENGEVKPPFDEYFCNTQDTRSTFGCDPDRSMIAVCDMVDVSKQKGLPEAFMDIPAAMSYFSDENLGSLNPQTDYCPVFSQYIGLSCREEPKAPGFNKNKWLDGEKFAEGSRCYDSNFQRPLCLETVCNADTFKIDLIVNGETKTCESDGEKIDMSDDYHVVCPRFATVCPNMVCPSSCAGQGECMWDEDIPYCKCFDSGLDSANCDDMPPGPRSSTSGGVASQSDSVSTSTAAANDNNAVLGELLKCGGAGDMLAIQKCAVDVISQSDLDESTKKDLAACDSEGGSTEMLACVRNALESAGGDPGGIVVTFDGDLVVPGHREPEQFVKCQPWCSAIPNEWEEKCSWKFSCGKCSKCR